MRTVRVKRNNKEYDITIGVTSEGKSNLYIDDVIEDSLFQQRKRRYLVKIEMKFDIGTGNIAGIGTTWAESTISNSGILLSDYREFKTMFTNAEDIMFLVNNLGNPIIIACANLFFRDTLGFNHFKPFDSITGAVKIWTPFQEATEPTFDYQTWLTGDPLPLSIIEP